MAVTPRLILMRPQRAGDAALIAHEQTHCRQMVKEGTVRFWWRYFTSRDFRLAAELEAYRVQLALNPSGLDTMADYLARHYWLGITSQQARALLLQPAK